LALNDMYGKSVDLGGGRSMKKEENQLEKQQGI